jgi:peptidoglycan hydrolase-like amidase
MPSDHSSTKRAWILLPLFLFAASFAAAQQEVSFGVLGLFHPQELQLEQASAHVLSVAANGVSSLVINGEPGHRQLLFRAKNGRVFVGAKSASSWTVTARDGGAVAFWLAVPGRFHRVYWGRLTIKALNGELVAATSMDRETAVASIVAAEMDESAPIEALKAQAVATRSFLSAGAKHLDFDFCDTTHCQFLKSPPPLTSRVSRAVQATRGLVIAYRGQPLAAMYSSRCGGHTRSLRDVGLEADKASGESYPYYAVPCAWCRKHPFTWRSSMDERAHAPQPGDERKRIAAARQLGWSAIPSSDFTAAKNSSGWQLEGHSVGHSVGMCQYGAIGMASSGASFRQILSHYYPNTSLISQP